MIGVMAELSEQQREFCRLVVRGLPGSEAYRKAYGCGEKSAESGASRLLRNAKVQEEIARLRSAADRRAVMDRQERMERLSKAAEDCQREGKYGDMVRNIAELNRMDGAYEPEKLEVSGCLGVGAVVAALQARGQRPPVH